MFNSSSAFPFCRDLEECRRILRLDRRRRRCYRFRFEKRKRALKKWHRLFRLYRKSCIIPKLDSSTGCLKCGQEMKQYVIKEVIDGSQHTLKILELSNRSDSNDLAIYALEKCSNLQGLDILDCDDAVSVTLLQAVGKRSFEKRSISLKVGGTTPLNSGVLLQGFSGGGFVEIDFGIRKLAVEGLRPIIESCRSLRSMNLSSFDGIDDDKFGEFVKTVKWTIERLKLYGGRITDLSYVKLTSCEELEHLEIGGAVGLGPSGLGTILGLPRLKRLDISDLGPELSSDQVAGVFRQQMASPMLEELKLEVEVADDALVDAVLSCCPVLDKLALETITDNLVTDEGIETAVNNHYQHYSTNSAYVGRNKFLSISLNGDDALLVAF